MSTDKIADLKAKFVAGAIPLESDYATLLNMLEETRVATGTSPDTPAGDTGLEIDDNTKGMKVKVAGDGLLEVNSNGLAIPITARLRIACGLLDQRPALYGSGNGIYVVAVPLTGYTVVHIFQDIGYVTPNTSYLFYRKDGQDTRALYTDYEFKYGPGINDGLNVLKAVWPVIMAEGDVVAVPWITDKVIDISGDPTKMTIETLYQSHTTLTLKALP